MQFFYDMLLQLPNFDVQAASWATAILAVLLVYCPIRLIMYGFKR